ncbi:ABC transporter permease subunit [Listeria costaricensis]|uniref:ABC transporter permease subunit n=1 Tax=Listeria costaricensis TaxID=2026604 RepID=UPI000C06E911|nr:ABC transporter permease subunit [Listeria costaricensis]
MMAFKAFVAKEWLEICRNLKIIWLPVALMLLGVMQPVMMYFLPQIIEKTSGIENGEALIALFEQQTSVEIFSQTLSSQFDQLGIMIILISGISLISADRQSGMLSFILTKPVSLAHYLSAKVVVQFGLIFVSLLAGYFLAAYYSVLLFGDLPLAAVGQAFFIYSIWIFFLFTLLLFLSTILESGTVAGILAIVSGILLTTLTGLEAAGQIFNPAYLSKAAVSLIQNEQLVDYFWPNLFVTLLISIALLIGSFFLVSWRPLSRQSK